MNAFLFALPSIPVERYYQITPVNKVDYTEIDSFDYIFISLTQMELNVAHNLNDKTNLISPLTF
jgi:hypothetical protein